MMNASILIVSDMTNTIFNKIFHLSSLFLPLVDPQAFKSFV